MRRLSDYTIKTKREDVDDFLSMIIECNSFTCDYIKWYGIWDVKKCEKGTPSDYKLGENEPPYTALTRGATLYFDCEDGNRYFMDRDSLLKGFEMYVKKYRKAGQTMSEYLYWMDAYSASTAFQLALFGEEIYG